MSGGGSTVEDAFYNFIILVEVLSHYVWVYLPWRIFSTTYVPGFSLVLYLSGNHILQTFRYFFLHFDSISALSLFLNVEALLEMLPLTSLSEL